MKRRNFLIRIGQAVAATTFVGSGSVEAVPLWALSASEERTLQAALEVLFPEETDSPGAVSTGGVGYLRSIMTDPEIDTADRQKLLEGVRRLERFERGFSSRSLAQRQEVMTRFVDTEYGESWASLILFYTLEGFLGDPIHGGNRAEAGWKWLEIAGGFPRPPKVKWYR